MTPPEIQSNVPRDTAIAATAMSVRHNEKLGNPFDRKDE
jgi:hypothetical protein